MKKSISTLILTILSAGLIQASSLTEDYVDIATSYIQKGKYTQALTYINKALMLEPQNNYLINMKNDLLKITDSTIHTNNNNFNLDLTFIQAEKLRAEQAYDKAIIFYKKAINENPDSSHAYLGLAIANYENKNFQEAKNNLNIYINKEPKADFAYMLRAKTNLNLGEGQSALRDIKSADAIFSNPEYELTEAIILTELGKYIQAKEILTKLSDELQIYIVFKYLGICDYKLGNYKNALLNFDRAIILFEDDKTILPMYNEAKRRNNEG